MPQNSFTCTIAQFRQLLELLKNEGYKLLGPTVRNGVIVLDELSCARDLPRGWRDEQDPGYYRLKPISDQAYFGHHVGPHSWKKYFFPSNKNVWSAQKKGEKIIAFQQTATPAEKLALIGVHACDLQALFVLDNVFNEKLVIHEQYHQRRKNGFILGIQCTTSVNTCFCTSMGSGPHLRDGYDLALTEIIETDRHFFLLTPGSAHGESLCHALALKPATSSDYQLGERVVEQNKEKMKRHVDNAHVYEMLMKSWNHPQWNRVAKLCINCANCTMACPTCFCNNTNDHVTLDGMHVDRMQTWESCFNLSHSYVHGGSIRSSAKGRYRQWLTHKFGTWWDQFGLSGCVGCGRCITWCPVGIDVTEELHQLGKENESNR